MEKAVTQDVTTFVLCNPHNPVGRVFTGKELEELFAFAARHDIVVVADEIHSDLILEGEHIPAITLNEAARQRVILHQSASTVSYTHLDVYKRQLLWIKNVGSVR